MFYCNEVEPLSPRRNSLCWCKRHGQDLHTKVAIAFMVRFSPTPYVFSVPLFSFLFTPFCILTHLQKLVRFLCFQASRQTEPLVLKVLNILMRHLQWKGENLFVYICFSMSSMCALFSHFLDHVMRSFDRPAFAKDHKRKGALAPRFW